VTLDCSRFSWCGRRVMLCKPGGRSWEPKPVVFAKRNNPSWRVLLLRCVSPLIRLWPLASDAGAQSGVKAIVLALDQLDIGSCEHAYNEDAPIRLKRGFNKVTKPK
jgi:hypothetical protein